MKQDIVFICLDSIRKDIFDQVAGRTQKLADISFDNCRAASSWSAPSHASMISGLLPYEHEVTTHSRSFNSLSEEKTFFGDLQEYRTVGISGNIYAGPSYHFDQYFDSFFTLERSSRYPKALSPHKDEYDMSVQRLFSYFLDSIRSDRPFGSLFNGITRILNSITSSFSWAFDKGAKPGLKIAQKELQIDEPSFIFLNLMDGHIPYRPARYLDTDFYDVPRGWSSDEKTVWELIQNEYDERYWNKRNQLYRATIDYLDRRMSEFIQSIDDETTIIVTADHGDNLGTEIDEGLANHKSSLSEGLLHVPFYVINAPKISKQTGQYLSHLSIPELTKGLANGCIPNLKNNQAFAELGGMSGGPDPESNYEYYDRAIRCAYIENEKIVWDSLGNCAKYQLDLDKANYQQYITHLDHPPLWATDRFNLDISTFKTNIIESIGDVTIDEPAAQRLEELGYL